MVVRQNDEKTKHGTIYLVQNSICRDMTVEIVIFSESKKQYLLYLVYSFSHIVVPLEYKIFF